MGGHGGLNILPQKRWNVYRQDNRQKVDDDEKLLVQARHEEEKKQSSVNLSKKVEQLKNPSSISVSADQQSRTDNDLYKRAKKEIKAREIGDKKMIEHELVHAAQDDRQHVNLFRQEQISEMIREKRQKDTLQPVDQDEYLKRTANLGDLMEKVHRPWYAKTLPPNTTSQDKDLKIIPQELNGLNQYMVGQQIQNFKDKQQLESIEARSENVEGFCQILTLNPTQSLLAKSQKHIPNDEVSDSESSSSSSEDEQKKKKDKKRAKKEMKREKKRQKKEALQKLREERLQREQEESKRVQDLLRRHNK